MAAMTLKNTPNPSVTIMPPLSFIAHAPGGWPRRCPARRGRWGLDPRHMSVPSSPEGSVWDDLPCAPGSIASTPMCEAHCGFSGPRKVSDGFGRS